MTIRKEHGKFVLRSKTTGKKLGVHKTRKAAEKQEDAINISQKSGHRIPKKR